MKNHQKITLTVYKFWEPLIILINRINHAIAKKHIQKYPQLASLSFEHIAMTINIRGRYEADTLELLEKFITQNVPYTNRKIALDIGANIGNHSVFLSEHFDEIYAFEPNPITFELLSINSRFCSSKGKIKVINEALGAEKGELNFLIDRLNLGGSRVINSKCQNNDDKKNNIMVKVQPGDDLKYLSNKDISLIKVDVEGHELQVFQGMRKILTQQRPIILFEQEKKQITNGSSEVIDFLKELNYEFFTIHKNYDGNKPKNYKFLKLLLKTLFGFRYSLVKTENFTSKFYDLIIAHPK